MPSDADDKQGFNAAIPAEAAFGMILAEICQDIDMHMAMFMESDDEVGAHKTRVGLRRLTTALDAFAPLLRRKARKVARTEAKAIFRQLGHVRDADVYLAGRPPEERTDTLIKETDRLRQRTRAKLRRNKAIGFTARLLRSLGKDDLLGRKRAARMARTQMIGLFAARALSDAWQTCQRHGDDLAQLNEEERHEFRKDMKTFRYLAEFFAALWPEAEWPQFRERLQALQDDLGLLNDLANARARTGETGIGTQELRTLSRADANWSALADAPLWWRMT